MHLYECPIDIETFAEVDLTTRGVYNYVQCPKHEILMITFWDREVEIQIDFYNWSPVMARREKRLLQILQDPDYLKTAHNAPFEIENLQHWYAITLDLEQWQCTAVLCAHLRLPRSLGGAGAALGLVEQKDPRGKELIKIFSMPRKPTVNDPCTRVMPADKPAEWSEYLRYNRQDVRSENAIRQALQWYKIPVGEKDAWRLDQKINRRGVRIDKMLCLSAIKINEVYAAELLARAVELTGMENPNSPAQIKNWIEGLTGTKIKSLTADTIPILKKEYADRAEIVEMLSIRQELSKNSISKYFSGLTYAGIDSRARGAFLFHGAGTGRWASRGIQLHNMVKNNIKALWTKSKAKTSHKDTDIILTHMRDTVRSGNLDMCKLFYGNVNTLLSQLCRTMLIPDPDNVFICSDFSAIEARVLAWLAGEQWRLDVFNTHGKIYEASAAAMFRVPLEEITKDSPLRAKGKIAELALGYQGSVNAMITFKALDEGLKLDELKPIVSDWRKASPNIVKYWKDVNGACINAVKYGSTEYVGVCEFKKENNFLTIKLPSGRKLAYLNPVVLWKTITPSTRYTDPETGEKVVIYDEPFTTESVRYDDINDQTFQPQHVYLYGGLITENITQAVARDLLVYKMQVLNYKGFDIVGHVHDEIILEIFRALAAKALIDIDEVMAEPVSWAKGLPLKGDTFITEFYKKEA